MNSQWRPRARFAPAGVTTHLRLQTVEGILSLEADGESAVWRTRCAQALRGGRMLAGLSGAVMAMLAFVFAAWSITAGLNWTRAFPWGAGPLSHWLTWCALGAALQMVSSRLGRVTPRQGALKASVPGERLDSLKEQATAALLRRRTGAWRHAGTARRSAEPQAPPQRESMPGRCGRMTLG
jgi:hypothetical protein